MERVAQGVSFVVVAALAVIPLAASFPRLLSRSREGIRRLQAGVGLYWLGVFACDTTRLLNGPEPIILVGAITIFLGTTVSLTAIHPYWRETAMDAALLSCCLVALSYSLMLLFAPAPDTLTVAADAMAIAGALYVVACSIASNLDVFKHGHLIRWAYFGHGALRLLAWCGFVVASWHPHTELLLILGCELVITGSYLSYCLRGVLERRKPPRDKETRHDPRLPHLPYLMFAGTSIICLFSFLLNSHGLHVVIVVLLCVAAVTIGWRQIITLDRYQDLASHDSLTHLANRGQLLNMLDDRLAQRPERIDPAAQPVPLAVLFVDLDRFKQVNDTDGHAVGDEVLRQVGDRFESVLRRELQRGRDPRSGRGAPRPSADLGRMGGDEFLIITSGLSLTRLGDLASALRTALERPFRATSRAFQIGGSIGIALAEPGVTMTAAELIRRADLAMYAAKRGRLGFTLYDPGLSSVAAAIAADDLQVAAALRDHRLALDLQPLVRPTDGSVQMVEALLRWIDEDGRRQGPRPMLDFAERSGQLDDLSFWVLEHAAALLQRSCGQVRVAVNVPATVLFGESFPNRVADLLDRHAIEGGSLVLEITEDHLVDTISTSAASSAQALRDLGVGLVVDDFGVGSSSMTYLLQLPLQGIKIDGHFITALPDSTAAQSLVRAVSGVGHDLGLGVVAEGVHTWEQHQRVLDLGLPLAQGFLYARPEPAETVLDPSRLEAWTTARGNPWARHPS